MKIVFTLCSNNYLAQAKTLGDSILRHNPDYRFFIGLTDKIIPEIDYIHVIKHDIIPVDIIGIPDLDNLWRKYNLIEFNTCVKPFYFKHIISNYPDLDFLFYLDPDIMVFNDLKIIENEFTNESKILLTPHILTTIEIDDKSPNENVFLNYGIYNLGFLGLKKPEETFELIDWWKERTYHMGFNCPGQGFFVDQLWFNLVPIIFKNVKISANQGLNMAPWNLHERILSSRNGEFIINNNIPLIFYHFSDYKYNEPDILSVSYNRYSFEDNTVLKLLYNIYNKNLIDNWIEKYSEIKCYYMILQSEYHDDLKRMEEIEKMRKIMSSPVSRIKFSFKKKLPKVILRVYKALINK